MNVVSTLTTLSWLASVCLGCISSDFNLGKNTWASSNSERDYNWAAKLIPGIEDQGATKFEQGKCAMQSKLVLDGSCFKIHHPTTWQHDQYKLRVSEIETVFSRKIESLKSNENEYHYDAFLDHNMGFYVSEIDSLIESFDELDVNYWLLQWQNNRLMKTTNFYSILVYSPGSQVLYEFMTINKPSNFENLSFLQSEMRATFEGFKPEYPWQPESKFHDYTILPVRVSRSVSNIDENVEWYENILTARTIYKSEDYETVSMGGDNIDTKVAFVINKGTSVEIAFVERSLDYTQSIKLASDDITSFLESDTESYTVISNLLQAETEIESNDNSDMTSVYNNKYSKYSIKDWETDLNLEHESIILNEFCGFTRWFDNHYGMQIWEFDGLLDKILTALRKYNYKYRVFKQSYQHTSDDGKELLDKYDKDNVYSLWIIEPNGQTIHVAGDLISLNDEFSDEIPTWDPQWCKQECGADALLKDGATDNVNDASDITESETNLVKLSSSSSSSKHESKFLNLTVWQWVGIGIGLAIILIGIFVAYYVLSEFDWKEIVLFINTHVKFASFQTGAPEEYAPLMHPSA